jgi:hypothetical protein
MRARPKSTFTASPMTALKIDGRRCAMMADLTGELALARGSITEADRAMLDAFEIPPQARDTIGVADVLLEDRIYQPLDCPIGTHRLFIVGVRIGEDAEPPTPESRRPESIAYCGALIDLLCFHPSAPSHWAQRRDTARWLGATPPQFLAPLPVRIRRSPTSWLRAGCDGLCILTRERREMQGILLRFPAIEAEDPEHAQELQRIRDLPFPGPPITVAGGAKRASAA